MSFNINEIKSQIYSCILAGNFGGEVLNKFLREDGSVHSFGM